MTSFGTWNATSNEPVQAWASGEQWRCRRESDGAMAIVTVLAYPSPTNASRLQRELDTLEALAAEGVDVPKPLGRVGMLGDGRPWAAVADIPGVTLDAYLMPRGPRLTEDEALQIAAKVSRVLAHAHARDLFHRDVRPANILLEVGTGRVVLVGWGDSSDRCLPSHMVLPVPAEVTRDELGPSPRYAPPEALPDPVPTDPARWDTYALSVTLCELTRGGFLDVAPREYQEPDQLEAYLEWWSASKRYNKVRLPTDLDRKHPALGELIRDATAAEPVLPAPTCARYASVIDRIVAERGRPTLPVPLEAGVVPARIASPRRAAAFPRGLLAAAMLLGLSGVALGAIAWQSLASPMLAPTPQLAVVTQVQEPIAEPEPEPAPVEEVEALAVAEEPADSDAVAVVAEEPVGEEAMVEEPVVEELVVEEPVAVPEPIVAAPPPRPAAVEAPPPERAKVVTPRVVAPEPAPVAKATPKPAPKPDPKPAPSDKVTITSLVDTEPADFASATASNRDYAKQVVHALSSASDPTAVRLTRTLFAGLQNLFGTGGADPASFVANLQAERALDEFVSLPSRHQVGGDLGPELSTAVAVAAAAKAEGLVASDASCLTMSHYLDFVKNQHAATRFPAWYLSTCRICASHPGVRQQCPAE